MRDVTVNAQSQEILNLGRENIRLERELAATAADRDNWKAMYEAAKQETTPFLSDEFAPQALEIFNVFAGGGLTEPAARESLLVRATFEFFAGTLVTNEQVMRQLMPVDPYLKARVPVDGLRKFAHVYNSVSAKSQARTPVGGSFALRLPEAPAAPPPRQIGGGKAKGAARTAVAARGAGGKRATAKAPTKGRR
jgi:hypothetical protein